MKLKESFVLTQMGDEYAAVPVGDQASEFRGIIRLNETGKDIWDGLADGLTREQIACRLVEEYNGVDETSALEATDRIIRTLKEAGILE